MKLNLALSCAAVSGEFNEFLQSRSEAPSVWIEVWIDEMEYLAGLE
jgi:hypothetical protein